MQKHECTCVDMPTMVSIILDVKYVAYYILLQGWLNKSVKEY